VRLLLDTHAALWWLSDDGRLGARSVELIEDGSSEVLLSAAVVLEVAIKRSIGKLAIPGNPAALLIEAGAEPLPIRIAHAEAVGELPWHHRDPFDRLLVAQARIEQAVVVSNDERLRPYDVPTVW
jgi:PIN domain nuclease of toxin-antitoxin system